ncbi:MULTISPECIES: Clp protease N-terminal domain-containing protein [Paenarthrobacter]|uniref:Clp protease N-terminal domain-containing protein n=1 Tax=Paenarthrobacter TaxID=1742992 RepID=UPI002365B24B|nr:MULTISPECIES: Clp protease N-terminal domain-containing protein [Paenarthrobacter]MDD7836785.1 Clp protease N-terminal domain-containing protein [Paenarthrobacter sp. AB444]MDP9935007.1 ATP-dependent Clp protease ATP-binding subunit ClpA [Paenarthrobacter nicotinovorans]
MFEQFTHDTRRIVGYAMEEARSLGDKRMGTEHLLLGALHERGPSEALGVSLEDARRAAARLDAAALKAIGFDSKDLTRAEMPTRGRKPPFSSGAKEVMAAMLKSAVDQKSRKITASSLVVSLLDRGEHDPVTALLQELRVDRAAVRDRLMAQ